MVAAVIRFITGSTKKTKMKVDSTSASSKIMGFGYIDNVSGSLSIGGFTSTPASVTTFSTTLPATFKAASTFTRLKFSGVGNSDVNNRWIIIPRDTSFRNSAPSYDVQALLQRTTSGVVLTVKIYNPTGVNQSVPNITVAIKTYFFDTVW